MNKDIKYQDIIKVQELLRNLVWQQEDELYSSLRDYLRRADEFTKGDILTNKQKEVLNSIECAVLLDKPVVVEVYGAWYRVRFVQSEMKLVVLDRRLPEMESEMLGDRVYFWEIQSVVIGQ